MTFKVTYRDDGVAVLEFDHGKTNEMGSAQLDALDALGAELVERGTRALITTSRKTSKRGTPIFVAGANVTERVGWSDAQVKAHVQRQRACLDAFRRLPLFHVVVVHGVALGWGAEYMITADYRVATPTASFALPETGLGIVPGAGGSSELWALIGLPQALRLGMTGERIDASEAARIGLIQEVVDDWDAAMARAEALAAMVAKRSPTAIAAFKAAALGSVGLPYEARRDLEDRAYAHCVDTGQAAVGRANFKAILSGEGAPWGPRVNPDLGD